MRLQFIIYRQDGITPTNFVLVDAVTDPLVERSRSAVDRIWAMVGRYPFSNYMSTVYIHDPFDFL